MILKRQDGRVEPGGSGAESIGGKRPGKLVIVGHSLDSPAGDGYQRQLLSPIIKRPLPGAEQRCL